MSRYWDHYYRPSTPKKAKGGIKAQSQRGAFSETWWGRRWEGVIEGFHVGARLGRGKRYARQGQVLRVEIEKGGIFADVQGSRTRPYQVAIRVRPISQKGWEKVLLELSGKALFAAALLGGEMPEEMEEVFRDAGHPLFPAKRGDLTTDCSCPDWSNPCKHIAAVYYLIAGELDRDPFLLLRLRGMDREELLEALGLDSDLDADGAAEEESFPPQPLPEDPALFWKGTEADRNALRALEPPPVSASLLKRLGPFPFWRGKAPLLTTLEPLYIQASQEAVRGFDRDPEETGER